MPNTPVPSWSFSMLREYPLDENTRITIDNPVRGKETYQVTSVVAVSEPNLTASLQAQTDIAMTQFIQWLTSHGATGMSEILDQVEAWCRIQRRIQGLGQERNSPLSVTVELNLVEDPPVNREGLPSRFERDPLV